jgi:hypothetical protein
MGERTGCRGARAGIGICTLLLLLASAGLPAGSATPAPRIVSVEEVLRQAARISWAESGAAPPHRLQRRTQAPDGSWSEWQDVRVAGDARSPAGVDAGPSGQGLAPGAYAYRIQGSAAGEWSAPAEFTMPEPCGGGDRPPGNEALGSLPTVQISDLDGDHRHTGNDVWLALQRCSKLGGCILEALPVSYDDVAISLYGENDKQSCFHWKPLVCEPMPPFPNGLVIQGHGSATVFRSPIWKTGAKPSPVFLFWRVPGVQLRFRNFVLDGRKREQTGATPGTNDANTWRHMGLAVTNVFGTDHSARYPDGCLHNVTARDFLGYGIEIDHARNWRIEYNRVSDVGCWKGISECPRLAVPDANPPPGWGCNGYKTPGYGIGVGSYSDDTHVVHNAITRATKYGIEIKGGGEGTDPMRGLIVRANSITNVGTVGMFLAGTIDSVVEGNTIDGTHAYGCRKGGASAFWGIQTNGAIRNTRVRDNRLRNLAGVGIGSNAVADGLEFSDNSIENVCAEQDAKVGNVKAAIHLAGGSSGTFALLRNTVTRNHCSMALAVSWGSAAQVVVEGGYYSIGDNSDPNYGALYVESGNSPRVPSVLLRGDVVFEQVGKPGPRTRGIVASGNGRVVVKDRSVKVIGFRDRMVQERECLDRCAKQETGSIAECALQPSHRDCRALSAPGDAPDAARQHETSR